MVSHKTRKAFSTPQASRSCRTRAGARHGNVSSQLQTQAEPSVCGCVGQCTHGHASRVSAHSADKLEDAAQSTAGHSSHAHHAGPPTPAQQQRQRRALLSALASSAAVAMLTGPAELAAPRRAAAALELPTLPWNPLGNWPRKPPTPPTPNDRIHDDTLAYEFTVPTKTKSGRTLPLTTSRRPEKYSSAAPLTPDARQRIVTELVSLADGSTVSVLVGPITGKLKGRQPDEWKPQEVATCVLTDRSVTRNQAGQRIPVAAVENSSSEDRNGKRYFLYETVQQGSPNAFDLRANTFRQGLSVTTERYGLQQGFLYTLNLSCPSTLWGEMQEGFQKAVDSFVLLDTGKKYVPPDKDPWLFF